MEAALYRIAPFDPLGLGHPERVGTTRRASVDIRIAGEGPLHPIADVNVLPDEADGITPFTMTAVPFGETSNGSWLWAQPAENPSPR